MRRRWTAAAAAAALIGLHAQAAAAGPESAPARWVPSATTGGPFAQFPNLSAFRDGSAFALVDGVQLQPGEDGATGVGVLRSRDGGRSWDAPLTQPSFQGQPLLAMASGKVGFFASGDVVSRTDDGATSWKRLAPPRAVPRGVEFASAVDATAGGRVAAIAKNGFEFADGCPYLLRRTPVQLSTDGGRSWAARPLPFTSYPTGVELASPARAVVTSYPYDYEEPVRNGDSCSVGGNVLREVRHSVTQDGGRTWRTAHECQAPCATTWADARTLVVVERDGTVLASRDAGRTLRRVGQLPGASAEQGRYVHAVDFLDARIGYAGVYGAGTFRTADGGRTWVLERPEVEAGGIGTFADVAPVDGLRAVAAGTSGIHARVADPLAAGRPAPVSAGPDVAAAERPAGQPHFGVDGTLVLPVRHAR